MTIKLKILPDEIVSEAPDFLVSVAVEAPVEELLVLGFTVPVAEIEVLLGLWKKFPACPVG